MSRGNVHPQNTAEEPPSATTRFLGHETKTHAFNSASQSSSKAPVRRFAGDPLGKKGNGAGKQGTHLF